MSHSLSSFYYMANPSAIVIWITGGILLAVGGPLAFGPFRFHAHDSDPLEPAQIYRSTEIDLAWTAIPILMLVLFLA